jgi:uncharacterized protein (DUF885 family)
VRRALRFAAMAAAGLLVLGAAFAVPVLWGRPWTIDLFFLRAVARFGLESPMLLSTVRILEPWGLDFHSDELDDFSVAHQLERAAWLRGELATLRGYDRASLSPERRLSYDVMEWFLATLVEGERFQFHDYPVNQLDGVQSRIPDFLVNIHQVDDEEGARDYLARLAKLPGALDQAVAGVRHRERLGVVPPRFVVERVQDEVRGLVAPAPAEHVLVRHLAESLAALDGVPAVRRDALVAEAERKVAGEVYPAYARLADALAELRPRASEEHGAWKHPDGGAYYAWTLRLHTTTALSPAEIHRVGLAETARIEGEIRRILAAEGVPADDLGAALAALHADPRFRYAEGERERILADYQAIVDETRARLPAWFGRLPEAPVVVRRVPAFKEEGAPGAYYMPPALDRSRPGVFYANLREVSEVVRFGMRTLAFHEAVPGHHLQIALAFENRALPLFRRLIPFNAFVEGWALYAERLAAEQGLHPTPLDRVGQLVAELFRAVRLVVDTGIHAERWTREEAIAWMRGHTGMPETDVVAEVERYVVNPGQACGYKLGQLEILRLRDRARERLGARFDLRAFHDAVLGGGSLPLVILERVVEDWIARQGG